MTTNQVLIGVGLELAPGELLEGITAVLLLTGSLLFLVRVDGRLAPVTSSGPPQPEPGDTMVLLCPAAGGP